LQGDGQCCHIPHQGQGRGVLRDRLERADHRESGMQAHVPRQRHVGAQPQPRIEHVQALTQGPRHMEGAAGIVLLRGGHTKHQ
jgi:hypothetical protein